LQADGLVIFPVGCFTELAAVRGHLAAGTEAQFFATFFITGFVLTFLDWIRLLTLAGWLDRFSWCSFLSRICWGCKSFQHFLHP